MGGDGGRWRGLAGSENAPRGVSMSAGGLKTRGERPQQPPAPSKCQQVAGVSVEMPSV